MAPRPQVLTEVVAARLTLEQRRWLEQQAGTPGHTIRQLIDKAMAGGGNPPATSTPCTGVPSLPTEVERHAQPQEPQDHQPHRRRR